jgi:hypothetical protein
VQTIATVADSPAHHADAKVLIDSATASSVIVVLVPELPGPEFAEMYPTAGVGVRVAAIAAFRFAFSARFFSARFFFSALARALSVFNRFASAASNHNLIFMKYCEVFSHTIQ